MRALFVALALWASSCSDEDTFARTDDEVCFDRSDGVTVCIEVWEASRRDATSTSPGVSGDPPESFGERLPWTSITWSAARDRCRAKGRRLCERDEWIDACDGMPGAGGLTYPYGNERDPSRCNVEGRGAPVAGGAFPGCRSPIETSDQAGNVWEWTGNAEADAVARGGGFRSNVVHDCEAGDRMRRFDPSQPSPEVGFRCCRELR